jgi:hypothetical protein
LSCHRFVGRRRARDKIKSLLWRNNGFCLRYRRVERRRYLSDTDK